MPFFTEWTTGAWMGRHLLLLFGLVCVVIAVSAPSCSTPFVGYLGAPMLLLGYGAATCLLIALTVVLRLIETSKLLSETARSRAEPLTYLLFIVFSLFSCVWMIFTFFVLFDKRNIPCVGSGDVVFIFLLFTLLPEIFVVLYFVVHSSGNKPEENAHVV